jgi:hypothetical protein
MLQLAIIEIDAAEAETNVVRARERMQLANRMIAAAVVSVNRWEVRG